jgi:hypothetical protein
MLKLEIPASLPDHARRIADRRDAYRSSAPSSANWWMRKGLGFFLQLGDFQYDTSMVFVAVFMLIALALMLYGIVRRCWRRRFLKWQN